MKNGDKIQLKDLAVELVEAIREKKPRKIKSLQNSVIEILCKYPYKSRRTLIRTFNKYIQVYVTQTKNI